MTKLTNFDPGPALDPRDMDDREELLPKEDTSLDDFTEDTIADPEGAKERQEAQDKAQFADWILDDFELDICGIKGIINPDNKELYMFPDGRYHLRPKISLIARVMELHTTGMEMKSVEKMKGLSDEGVSNEDYECISNHYEEMVGNLPKEYHFGIISGVGNAVNGALADRAFQKDKAIQAKNRFTKSTVIPEWVTGLQVNAINASTRAGIWYKVHQELWSQASWKGSPSYQDWAIESEIVRRCQNDADYKDANKRGTGKEVTISDWSAMDVESI